jgi:hypothetical protein
MLGGKPTLAKPVLTELIPAGWVVLFLQVQLVPLFLCPSPTGSLVPLSSFFLKAQLELRSFNF